ncbi:uncharacterized protein LOC117103748 [Anneissia japonica]|uniref:uncharacterized protein LOC117103748 n=1 Tax=Anneissia japonica TaxID=1529436 RepID=UPI00142555C4|nr:uncharacterized protein LOC117103748 [Anneissia japonica]
MNGRKTSEEDAIEQINERVRKVFNKYLKEKKEDGKFITGYVEGTEVLETFLEDYKRAGGVSFSIRDSWRRSGLTSQPRLRELEPGKDIVNDLPRPSVSDEDRPNSKTQSPPDVQVKSQSTQKSTGALESQCRILWQSSNGTLKIPNLGLPFIIQAYERRVCTFTCTRRGKRDVNGSPENVTDEAQGDTIAPSTGITQPDTSTASSSATRKRKPISKNGSEDDTLKKKRVRKSMKKDCKAVIELKEIWVFAEYKPTFAEGSSDHAKRKVREKIISLLQREMRAGKVKYLRRYYLRLPYPEVHSDHEIGMNNKQCKINPFVISCIQNLVTEGITAVKNVQHHLNNLVKVECQKSSKRYVIGLDYDNSYYPDEKTIRNHIYLAMNAQKAKTQDREPEVGRPPSPRHIRLLSNTASNVRSELKEINNLTQKCQDVQLLTELLTQIEKIRKQFQDKLDKNSLLPREPIPSISTQDSHALMESSQSIDDALNHISFENPAADSVVLDIDTDLEAANILQSFTSNSFTSTLSQDGMSVGTSQGNFDSIPAIPVMLHKLVTMIPQQPQLQQPQQQHQQQQHQQHHQHQQNQQQQQPQHHQQHNHQQQNQQHSQGQQQQLPQNLQHQEPHFQLMQPYMPSAESSPMAPPQLTLLHANIVSEADIASLQKGRTIPLPHTPH